MPRMLCPTTDPCPACGQAGHSQQGRPNPDRLDATAYGGPDRVCRRCHSRFRYHAAKRRTGDPGAVLGLIRSGGRAPHRPVDDGLACEPHPCEPPPLPPGELAALCLAVRAEGLAALRDRPVATAAVRRYRFERAPEPERLSTAALIRLVNRPLHYGGMVRFFDVKPPKSSGTATLKRRSEAIVVRNRQRKALGIRDRP